MDVHKRALGHVSPRRVSQHCLILTLTLTLTLNLTLTLTLTLTLLASSRRNPNPTCEFPSQVVYSQFRGLVDQGKVASARFDDSSQRVYFELRPEYLRQVKTAAGDLAWPEGASR